MSISQKLDLKQSQQLVMTPQLQQAIKLLQLTNLELQEYVEAQLLENPFLERDERADAAAEQAPTKDENASGEQDLTLTGQQVASTEALDTDYDAIDPNASQSEKAQAMRERGEHSDWASAGGARNTDFDDLDLEANLTKAKSLREILTEQLQLAVKSEAEIMIGTMLIDLIDDGGYLRADLEEVADRLGASQKDVLKVLEEIQTFEPSGVGARTLQECLLLQLREQGKLDEQMQCFLDNLHMLGAADIKGLRKATGMSEEEIHDLISEIRSLTPKPGLAYGHDAMQMVVPDVFVHEAEDGGWKIELNTETLPRVIANQKYFAKLDSACVIEKEKSYLTEQISNANWLVKSLDQRARTILKVSSEIVRQQDAFFVYGVNYLKPLNLKAVADAIEMHESTVSRVTSNKYVATPRGTFELKYFFTSAIASATGVNAHSAESVRNRIKDMIDREDPKSILSDDRIVSLLKEENVDIARRTVAKYREAMNIPSSVQRRRQKKLAI